MLMRSAAVMFIVGLIATPAFAAPKSATDKIVDVFMELDSNHSDGVSYAEYKAMVNRRATARFRQMDANRDGEVSEAEYRAFWRKTKSKWYRLNR